MCIGVETVCNAPVKNEAHGDDAPFEAGDINRLSIHEIAIRPEHGRFIQAGRTISPDPNFIDLVVVDSL